jgi:hypothetical protein
MATTVKTLAELLEQQFGVKTAARINPTGNSIAGLSPVQVAPNNPSRLGLLLMNLSPNNIYAMFDPAPSATRGILLQANGGGFTLVWTDQFDMVTYEWWVLASTAGSQMAIFEVVIFGTGKE